MGRKKESKKREKNEGKLFMNNSGKYPCLVVYSVILGWPDLVLVPQALPGKVPTRQKIFTKERN